MASGSGTNHSSNEDEHERLGSFDLHPSVLEHPTDQPDWRDFGELGEQISIQNTKWSKPVVDEMTRDVHERSFRREPATAYELMAYSPAHITLDKFQEYQEYVFDSRAYYERDLSAQETEEALQICENKKDLLQRLRNLHSIRVLKYKGRLMKWANKILEKEKLLPENYGMPGVKPFFAGTERDQPLTYDYFTHMPYDVDETDDDETSVDDEAFDDEESAEESHNE